MLMNVSVGWVVLSFFMGIAVSCALSSMISKHKEIQKAKDRERKKLLREALIRKHLIRRARKRLESKQRQQLDKTPDKQS